MNAEYDHMANQFRPTTPAALAAEFTRLHRVFGLSPLDIADATRTNLASVLEALRASTPTVEDVVHGYQSVVS
jgi:hypothetical protein